MPKRGGINLYGAMGNNALSFVDAIGQKFVEADGTTVYFLPDGSMVGCPAGAVCRKVEEFASREWEKQGGADVLRELGREVAALADLTFDDVRRILGALTDPRVWYKLICEDLVDAAKQAIKSARLAFDDDPYIGGYHTGRLRAAATLLASSAALNRVVSVGRAVQVEARVAGQALDTAGDAAEGSVFHATRNARAAQGVLDGINAKYLSPDSRFGRAFYVAEEAGTALAEVGEATHGIRFSVDLSNARVLDLTDASTAARVGYAGGPISSATQAIGARALQEGYDVIRFPSLRGEGANLAVLRDYNTFLTPQMVTPVP